MTCTKLSLDARVRMWEKTASREMCGTSFICDADGNISPSVALGVK